MNREDGASTLARVSHPFTRSDVGAVLFAGTYTLLAGAFALTLGNVEFVFYVAVLVVLGAALAYAHRRVGFHPACIWALAVWGLMHMAGGLYEVEPDLVLYSWRPVASLPRYDQVVHAYGFGVATWVVWQALARRLADPTPTAGMLFVALCGGMGLGALNEVVEFTAVLLIPETNVGGYLNTGWDLVSNLTGSLLAVLAIRWKAR